MIFKTIVFPLISSLPSLPYLIPVLLERRIFRRSRCRRRRPCLISPLLKLEGGHKIQGSLASGGQKRKYGDLNYKK